MNTEENLKQEVEILTSEVKRTHRYSMSRIYGLYNKVFGTNETPQSCASCLIRKVRQLTHWLEEQEEVIEVKAKPKARPKGKKK